MKYKVNLDIAFTHIITQKRQTLVTALGITIGVSIYLFMNSLNAGFTEFSRDNIFQNSAHVKIYKSDEVSEPLLAIENAEILISNPQVTTTSKKLNNPNKLLAAVRSEPYITNAIPLVDFSSFYHSGSTALKGSSQGVNIQDYAEMFNTEELMVAGSINALENNQNGIIIGSGIASKLNLSNGDNLTISSSSGVYKTLRVVGIFTTGSRSLDETRSYVNISMAQQFLKEGKNYVTTLYANTADPYDTETFVSELQSFVDYEVEDWKTTNQDLIKQDETREMMMTAISLAILVMAAFGIYNILSTTISQKINDIAILKATGFNGRDVINIFILEAIMIGIVGTVLGIAVGIGLIFMMSTIYIGQPVGYFPISVRPNLVVISFCLGMLLTLCAGYFPARTAADVDPIEIFRK
ncbi:MAG: ABC transporter permease [Bacteroidota bacterium]